MQIFLLYLALLVSSFSGQAVEETNLTAHERHLRKLGYWSLHQEIKSDFSSYLKGPSSIGGNKAVAYLGHLSQQIENLLNISSLHRLKAQNDQLGRLSEWIYAICAHACGFSGFEGVATSHETKVMERALTFCLISCPHQPTLIIKSIHESFYPPYLNNSDRQFFFKSFFCRKDIILGLWGNYLNGWTAAHYKYVITPQDLEEQRKNFQTDQEELKKNRKIFQEQLNSITSIQKNLEEGNYGNNPEILKEIQEAFLSLQEAFQQYKNGMLRDEAGVDFIKDLAEFGKTFFENFDYEELDKIIEPYVCDVKNLVGIHPTANPSMSLFGQYRPAQNQKEAIIKIAEDESYYEQEDPVDYSDEILDKKISTIENIKELINVWKSNGVYHHFRYYFKSLYIQELKKKRRGVLNYFLKQPLGGTLDETDRLREEFPRRVKEYAVLKRQPQPITKLDLRAANIKSNLIVSNRDEVTIDSQTFCSSYGQSVSSGNFFGKQVYGSKTYQEVKAPSQIDCRMIILGRNTKLTIADSTIFPKDIKILGGSYRIKPDPLVRTWRESWGHRSQKIADPVVCALSIGAGVLTQGLATGLMGVGLSAVSSTAIHATLSGQDPIKAVSSEGFLKNLAVQVATSGLTNHLAQSLNVNVGIGSKPFVDHVSSQALRAAIHTSLTIAVGDKNIQQSLTGAIKSIGVNSVAAFSCNQIGDAYGMSRIDGFNHKAAHGIIGGISGYALKGNREAIISGAVGAIAAEVAFEMMVPEEVLESRALETAQAEIRRGNNNPDDITRKVVASFQGEREAAKIVGLMAGEAAGKNATIALQTAEIAVDNNNVIALVVRAAPVINWAIANPDKIIKGIQNVATLYNIYERTSKDTTKQNTETRKKQDKPITYPDTPDRDEGKPEKDRKYRKIRGTPTRECKEDGSIWEPNKGKGHGDIDGEKQWKRWPDKKSWERGDNPESIWPDGRIRDSKANK